ncbi:MAG: NAD(P)-dependent alcohol dehydrogenase [Myxococcota bacterium]
MNAVVHRRYGPPTVLEMARVPRPTPNVDEVLVKVLASSINAGDRFLMRGSPFPIRLMFGLFSPKLARPGADVAGRVVRRGANVVEFAVGDEVMADLSDDGFGAYAEYIAAPAARFVRKPASVSSVDAGVSPVAALTALQAVRDHGRVAAGDRVLVYGASGGVGHFAVQLAKHMGAHVTAATSKVNFARELGADSVIDYRNEDFSRSGTTWDVIIGAGGSRPLRDYARALKPSGRFVHTGGSIGQLLRVSLCGRWHARQGKTLNTFLARVNREDLEHVASLLGEGILRPWVAQKFPLSTIVEAMTHYESGRVCGKIALTP